MSMEVTAWMSLYHAMNAQEDRRPFSRATLRRIVAFARPHRRKLIRFLVLSVVGGGAGGGDAGAGRPGGRRDRRAATGSTSWSGWPLLIAVIAVAEAGLGLLDPLAVGDASARG